MALSRLVGSLFELYGWLIFARLIVSWIRLDPYHPVVQFLYRITEPVLKPARQLIPPAGGLDFSPIVVFIVLRLVGNFIVRLLWSAGL